MPLDKQDREKFNELYLSINNIKIPQFWDEEARNMGEKVGEGLQIIKQAIKEVSTIIK